MSTLLVFSLAIGLSLGITYQNPSPILALSIVIVLLPFLWYRTVLGVYLLVAGAILFENFSLNFPDSLLDKVPFFQSFSSMGGPLPLPVTPAELLMVLALGIVMLKRMAVGEKPLTLGPLFWAVGVYTLMVIFGLVRGVGTGGNLEMALWEARAQVYLFFTYLLVFNLIQDRGQVRCIVWIFLVTVALKGLVGSWRYLVTLGGDLSRVREISTTNSLLAHEESIFFALFFAFILIMFLFRGDTKQRNFALLASLPVMIAFLGNQRRAGTLALLLCVLVIGLMAYALMRSRRKPIVSLALLVALALPPYVLVFGSSTSLIAGPANAIVSIYRPNDRDSSSNAYRALEAQNVKHNISLDPALGSGYGKAMVLFVPVPDLTSIFSFWDLIPHNTILWVWMRLGFLGFVSFWFLVGRTLVEASLTARKLRAPYFQGLAVFTIAAVVAWLAEGVVDMGLTDFRETILIGTLIGLISRLPDYEKSEGPVPEPLEPLQVSKAERRAGPQIIRY